MDPLLCPKCGEMQILNVITGNDVIRKILDHLGVWEEKSPVERTPPLVIHDQQYELYDGWTEYEEPSVTFNSGSVL